MLLIYLFMFKVSLLSLVDLACSEPTAHRGARPTNMTSALMCLHQCLQWLRKPRAAVSLRPPYHEWKITRLFKSFFFDSYGSVRMLLCVNPEDVSANLQILTWFGIPAGEEGHGSAGDGGYQRGGEENAEEGK